MFKKITLVSLLLVMLLTSCKSTIKVPRPASAAKTANELQVNKQSTAFIEETQLLSLSRDGKWFFGQRLESVCIFDAATLAQKVCADWKTNLDPNSISWSPDSQKVAFTENVAALTESDIWVFDISTGSLSDLTNDGLEGDLSTALQRAQSASKDINLDGLPVWSPDGKTLAFVRSVYGDKKETIIDTIPSTGGNVSQVIIADDKHSLAVWRGMRWTPDGKDILFTINVLDDTTGKNGIWIVDKAGKKYKQLAKEKEGWGYIALFDISPKGDKALVGYPRAINGTDQNPNLCFYELMDMTTGALTPLIDIPPQTGTSNAQQAIYSPTQAVFSPDGSKILYHNNLGGDQITPQLVVQDIQDAQKQVLGNWSIYTGDDVGPSLFWAANDTIYMMSRAGTGTVYQLGAK